MKKFIKITTRDGEAIIRSWISVDEIAQLRQNSITEEGKNEGTCRFADNITIPIIAFSETIESLNN